MINISKDLVQGKGFFPINEPITKDEFILKSKVIMRTLLKAWEMADTRLSIVDNESIIPLTSGDGLYESNVIPPSDFDEHYFVRLAESIIFDTDLIKLINTLV